jgi:hypothetical protein
MAKMKTGKGVDQVIACVQEKGKPRDGAADGDCALESVGGHTIVKAPGTDIRLPRRGKY